MKNALQRGRYLVEHDDEEEEEEENEDDPRVDQDGMEWQDA